MSNFKDEIEMRVYRELCCGCPNSKKCHDDCVTCEKYDTAVDGYLNNPRPMNKAELEAKFLNQKVHVVIRDCYSPVDAVGYVVLIDDACQLHGTWGSLAAILPYDSVELINNSISDVGIDFASVHGDYGTIVGKCFIYCDNSSDDCYTRSFNFDQGSDTVIICRLIDGECLSDEEFAIAEQMLLENLKLNLDLFKVPTLDEWLNK